MNKITSILLLVATPMLHACAAETAVDPQPSSCQTFIADLKAGESQGRLEFDIERSLNLTSENYTSAYDAIEPLGSGCSPGEIDRVHPSDIKAPWDTRSQVDVAAGVVDDLPWIQFVYPAISEAGPGLASSIVFYDEEAHPHASHLVSGYYAWENATSLRSMLSSGTIRFCTQHIEYFSYDENGDIADALDEPTRSDCKDSFSTYPTSGDR